MSKFILIAVMLGACAFSLTGTAQEAPSGLLCDLLTHPEKWFIREV
jgi:hypothetical protein